MRITTGLIRSCLKREPPGMLGRKSPGLRSMPTKKPSKPLIGVPLIKETCRRIRVARGYWEAHNNRACRGEREKALALYESLDKAEREKVPQVLRVWLRYRSENYFGGHRTPPRNNFR